MGDRYAWPIVEETPDDKSRLLNESHRSYLPQALCHQEPAWHARSPSAYHMYLRLNPWNASLFETTSSVFRWRWES